MFFTPRLGEPDSTFAAESSSGPPSVIRMTKFFWQPAGAAVVGLLSIGER
jgi:hypothetical protein